MASVVEVCNLALGWVGGSLITSLEDDSKEANLCKANFDYLRDAVIEDAEWTFAIKRASIVALAETPEWGYAHALQLPTDLIRLLTVRLRPDSKANDVAWEKEEDTVLSDAAALYIRYLFRVTDPNKWSQNFIQALAARLATEFAIPLASSRQLQADMKALYDDKLSTAKNTDGLQGLNRPVVTRRFKNARRTTRGGGGALY